MKNCLCLNGKKIGLTAEQMAETEKSLGIKARLADKAVGDVVKIGNYEFIVLEHSAETTAVIMKDFLTTMKFGSDCDFKNSDAKKVLDKFADEFTGIVGESNLITHSVDLTSDDGLKDYGKTTARISLLTCDLYRRYVEIIDKFDVDDWWWLATPYSTPKHGFSSAVKCVSPSGDVGDDYYCDDSSGVRPFCILNSDIFVS